MGLISINILEFWSLGAEVRSEMKFGLKHGVSRVKIGFYSQPPLPLKFPQHQPLLCILLCFSLTLTSSRCRGRAPGDSVVEQNQRDGRQLHRSVRAGPEQHSDGLQTLLPGGGF